MNLPSWAMEVANPTDKLCKCEKLPYLAAIPLKAANGKHRQSTSMHLVCRSCLMLEQASRKEIDFQGAIKFAESLEMPERDASTTYRKLDIEHILRGSHWYQIETWENIGWLVGWKRVGRNVVIPHAAFMSFLANPATWVAWKAEDLTELDLHVWASALRNGWPWRWMEAHEIARHLGYSYHGAYNLCRSSALRGAVQYQRAWFVRSDEVERFRVVELPRRGPGPEPIYGEKMVQENSYMPLTYRDEIREYGNGNLSAGIRRLWEEHLSRQQ